MRAAIYVTASYSEFFADPRIVARNIESLTAFVSGKGWSLVAESNMEVPGVFYDPADTDKFKPAELRPGCRAAIESTADVLVVANLIRLAGSLYKLTSVLDVLRRAGKTIAVQDGDLQLGDIDLAALKRVERFHKQTHGGRVRVPKAVAILPGRPKLAKGPLSPFETKTVIDGQTVRVPNRKALREFCRAVELRESGLSWHELAERLEEELAKEESRPMLDEQPIKIERYIRKCGKSQHTADWNFREFIEEHSFNRPHGTISRRWGRVRLIRLMHRERHKLEKWLSDRGLKLEDFAEQSAFSVPQ